MGRTVFSKAKPQHGFTLVELLIVIVVIAILATISVVAYNGIQDRANIAVAKSDLRSIAQRMELYKIDHGSYPVRASDDSYPEHEEILKSSGLYDVTRWTGDVDSRADRGYAFCLSSDLKDSYTVVAFEPMYGFFRDDGPSNVGQPLYYISQGGGLHETTIKWDSSIEEATNSGVVGKNLCKSVDPNYDPAYGVVWSYSVPTPYAP